MKFRKWWLKYSNRDIFDYLSEETTHHDAYIAGQQDMKDALEGKYDKPEQVIGKCNCMCIWAKEHIGKQCRMCAQVIVVCKDYK